MDALMNQDTALLAILALSAMVLSLVTVIISIVLVVRQRKLLNRYKLILNGPNGPDLEQLLLAQDQSLNGLKNDLGRLQQQVTNMAAAAQLHIQKTAIVRFNAFPDTGSDLSFAIALMDANNNGFVLSSLYGRSESRTYAKPIQNGKSTYQLSDEEKEAISKAMAQS